MKPLPQDRLDKTLLGLVYDWNELFIEHRYGRLVRQPGIRGSETPHPEDFYFLCSEMPELDKRTSAHFWHSLYVKPNPKIEPVINSVCTPPIGRAVRPRNNIQSYRVIPWPDYGMALVTATDVNMIANPWVCFIPLSAVPEINPDNTPMFSESDYPKWDNRHDY